MAIKHLVLSGGGINGIKTLGILERLLNTKTINFDKLESIYATSVGGFIAVLIALKFPIEDIIDYFIKRPWNKVIHVSLLSILNIVLSKGILNKPEFVLFFQPFLQARQLSTEITLEDLYKETQIEIHFFTLNLNKFEIEDLNHKTYPKLGLLTAIQMSSAVPCLVQPVFINETCYIDGAFGMNYPIQPCLKEVENADEIFGICNIYVETKTREVTNASNFFHFIIFIFYKMIQNIFLNQQHSYITNELKCPVVQMSIFDFYDTIKSQSKREELLEQGKKIAEEYI